MLKNKEFFYVINICWRDFFFIFIMLELFIVFDNEDGIYQQWLINMDKYCEFYICMF